MNILVSTNSRYLHITALMLFSLSENVSYPFAVWCMHSRLTDGEKTTFQRFLHDKCGGSEVHFVEMSWLKDAESIFPLSIRHISVETYYRLFAQFVLPSHLDRILWLDSDIIVKGPIVELYDHNIDGVSLVAFPNMGEASVGGNAERLGLPSDFIYFNAGVLLLNLTYLRENTSKDQILKFFVQRGDSFRQQDQDALNLLFYESARVINDQRFNCMVNAPKYFSRPDITQEAAIIHYAGRQKPWKIKWQNAYSCYWWETKRRVGLTFKDSIVFLIGNLWRVLGLNTFEKWLLAPYHWCEARLRNE